jgi:hypothetical protein
MGKAEPIALHLEDPCFECAGEPGLRLDTYGLFDEANGRRGEGSDDARDLDLSGSESIDALVHELVEVGGDRQLFARLQPPASSHECAREFECEERVAAGRLPDPQQRRTRKCSDPRPQQFVERAKAERSELDRQEPLLGDAPPEPGRYLVARGHDRGDRLSLEAGQSEPKHCERWRVEPLNVVDHEQEAVAAGKRSQSVQEGERDDALAGRRTVGVRERERHFERAPLRTGEVG